MIEFNLLPDVKLEYIKTRRIKRMVVLGSFIAASVCLVIMIVLIIFVDGLQKKHLNDISKDITKSKNQISSITDFNKVLTIQNQLISLPQLDAQKPVTSRLFGYLEQLVPLDVTLSRTSLDFNAHTIDISGDALSLASVDQLADTLKSAYYTKSSKDTAQPLAFTDVVLSSFSLDNGQATYDIQADYDPAIFDVANSTLTINVPPGISTRSVTDQPDLFKQSTTTNNTNAGQ